MGASIVIVVIVWIAASLAAYALLGLVFAEDRVVARRLRGMTAFEQGQAKDAQPMLKALSERLWLPVVDTARRAFGSFGPAGYRGRVLDRLALAGDPWELSPEAWLAIKGGIALALGGVVSLAVVAGVMPTRTFLLALPLALVGGWYLPELVLRSRTDQRKNRIRRQLPDMLDMLTISVEAGLGFDAALAKYVKNSDGDLGKEFARVLQEVQSGAARRVAMKRLVARTDVPELNAFVSAMVQADLLGTSVSSVLRAQAHEMRLKRRQLAEEQAQKLPVKMVFPLVLCILPATLIVVLGPAVIEIARYFSDM